MSSATKSSADSMINGWTWASADPTLATSWPVIARRGRCANKVWRRWATRDGSLKYVGVLQRDKPATCAIQSCLASLATRSLMPAAVVA